jgi:hypothetical protein
MPSISLDPILTPIAAKSASTILAFRELSPLRYHHAPVFFLLLTGAAKESFKKTRPLHQRRWQYKERATDQASLSCRDSAAKSA